MKYTCLHLCNDIISQVEVVFEWWTWFVAMAMEMKIQFHFVTFYISDVNGYIVEWNKLHGNYYYMDVVFDIAKLRNKEITTFFIKNVKGVINHCK